MNKLARLFLLVAAWSALLAGCASPPPSDGPATASLDAPVTLAIGESLTFDGNTLTFVAVGADSRCPSRVQCAWIGQANVQMRLETVDGQRNDFNLSTIHSSAKTTQSVQAGHVIELQALEPYPETPDRAIPKRDYRATLAIASLATADCPLRENDPHGYLTLICRYVHENDIDVKPADPARYEIKETAESMENGRPLVTIFLNCCGMGDMAVIDSDTGEVLSFRAGAY